MIRFTYSSAPEPGYYNFWAMVRVLRRMDPEYGDRPLMWKDIDLIEWHGELLGYITKIQYGRHTGAPEIIELIFDDPQKEMLFKLKYL